MNSIIGTLYRAEFRMLFRDRRTVIISIVLPLLTTPLLMFGSHWMAERSDKKLETTEFRYAVTGNQQNVARDLVRSCIADTSETPLLLKEEDVDSAADSLKSGALDFYIMALYPETEDPDSTLPTAEPGSASETSLHQGRSVLTLKLFYRGDRHRSEQGMGRLSNALRHVRTDNRYTLIQEKGFPVDPESVITLEELNIATDAQASGLHVGRIVVLFFLLFILSGGSVVATDSLAGEKERGTLETLLTTAASRADIVTAKHLVILTVAAGITIIQSANLMAYMALRIIPLPENLAFSLPPGSVILVLVFLLPVAALASSVLLLTSGYAKTYKEAQLYFFPIFLLGMLPATASFLPGISLRSAVVLVPVANVAVAVKEILVGNFDWVMLGFTWAITAGAAIVMRRLAERTLSTERLIVPGAGDAMAIQDRPALFQRHVLPAFAMLWALFFIVSSNLEGRIGLRVQVLVNLVVLFLGGSFFLIRRYNLDPRKVLALRPVRPLTWPLLVLGVPAGLIATTGVFKFVSVFLPVPQEILESFHDYLLPADIPTWQLLFFVAVLPGICEEIAFRGVLLHGLRRKFHPAVLAVVVGMIFGLFHMALFRIFPVAFLGIILASLTLLTGSIFPAMLWHALNNALGILGSDLMEDFAEFDVTSYLGAALVLVLIFGILYRNRTSYPDLRNTPPGTT